MLDAQIQISWRQRTFFHVPTRNHTVSRSFAVAAAPHSSLGHCCCSELLPVRLRLLDCGNRLRDDVTLVLARVFHRQQQQLQQPSILDGAPPWMAACCDAGRERVTTTHGDDDTVEGALRSGDLLQEATCDEQRERRDWG